MRITGSELVWVFLIILLLFGSRRLPDLARSLGRSMRELRKASDGEGETEEDLDRSEGSDGRA